MQQNIWGRPPGYLWTIRLETELRNFLQLSFFYIKYICQPLYLRVSMWKQQENFSPAAKSANSRKLLWNCNAASHAHWRNWFLLKGQWHEISTVVSKLNSVRIFPVVKILHISTTVEKFSPHFCWCSPSRGPEGFFAGGRKHTLLTNSLSKAPPLW